MISIVIPLYNKEKQIQNTLKSVFNQTFQDFEIVIVNDGSTDHSVEVVKQINNSRIRLIEQTNQGVSAARNTGIKEAKYDYIALVDADDEWKPTYLETQLDLINSFPECSVFACAYEFRRGEKTIQLILNRIPFEGEKGILSNYFEVASCSHPPLWTSAVVAKKEAFLSIGGFPVGIKSGEDLLTWARLAVKYKIAYSLKNLAVFIGVPSDPGKSKPMERYNEKDEVLIGLTELYDMLSDSIMKNHLKQYIFRWYKIQCVILLQIKKRKDCIRKAFEAIFKGGSLFIFFPISILAFLPWEWSMRLLGKKVR
jgi:Glycosyltransferases involved in cell wall biogenesis